MKLDFEQRRRSALLADEMAAADELGNYADVIIYLRDELARIPYYSGFPIRLTDKQEATVKQWSADTELGDMWGNAEAREINLRTFARAILDDPVALSAPKAPAGSDVLAAFTSLSTGDPYLPEAPAGQPEREGHCIGTFWTEAEVAVIDKLSKKQEFSHVAVLRQALRNYQLLVDGTPQLPDKTLQPSVDNPLDYWRCFHCDFATHNREEAEAHFGDRDDAEEFKPICKWWATIAEDERAVTLQDYLQQLNYERMENYKLSKQLEAPAPAPLDLEKIAEEISYWGATNPKQKELYMTEIRAILARHLGSGEAQGNEL